MSPGVAPNVAWSRKRAATLELMRLIGTVVMPETSVAVSPEVLGFVTVTSTPVPADWVALPVARNCVAETKVVVSLVPPNVTDAPFTNFVPVTPMVNAPGSIDAGITEVTVGIGFISVNVTVPILLASAWLVAAIVMGPLGIAAGAV